MPERMIKPEILTDELVDRLSAGAELFYRRFMSVVDDYGRFDGRPAVLRANLYPLKLDIVTDAQIEEWLAECVHVGLIRLYVVEGKKYAAFVSFEQRLRAKRSKWPAPPQNDTPDGGLRASADTCRQVSSNATESESESESESGAGTRARATAREAPPAPFPASTIDLQASSPVPEGAVRPMDDPLVRAICETCNVLAMGVNARRDQQILRLAVAIRASGGNEQSLAQFVEYKREQKHLGPNERPRITLEWLEADWGDFVAEMRGREMRAENVFQLPPVPDGLTPGEQKRWIQEQLQRQRKSA